MPYPCVIKPRFGEKLGLPAAQRYAIAHTPEEFILWYGHFSALAKETPIVQERLPGSGLGCSVLCRDGEIVNCICHRRIRELPVTGGPSTCCETIFAPGLEEYAARIAAACRYTGPLMLEFKEDADGIPRFLEANPRVWGTYPLTRAAKTGFSLAWFTLAWNAGNPEQVLPLPAQTRSAHVRMCYFPSDLIASLQYLRHGEPGRLLSAAGDFFNPAVRDGLFERRDMRPGFTYLRALLKRIRVQE